MNRLSEDPIVHTFEEYVQDHIPETATIHEANHCRSALWLSRVGFVVCLSYDAYSYLRFDDPTPSFAEVQIPIERHLATVDNTAPQTAKIPSFRYRGNTVAYADLERGWLEVPQLIAMRTLAEAGVFKAISPEEL